MSKTNSNQAYSLPPVLLRDFIPEYLENLKKQKTIIEAELKTLPSGSLMITKERKKYKAVRISTTNNNRKRTYIGSEPELLYRLAHKAYLQKLLGRIEKDIFLLAKIKSKWQGLTPKDTFEDLPRNFDKLNRSNILQGVQSGRLHYPRPAGSDQFPMVFLPYRLENYDNLSGRLQQHVLNARAGKASGHETGEKISLTPEEWAELPYRDNDYKSENKVHPSDKGFSLRSKSELMISKIYDSLGILYHYDEFFMLNYLDGGRENSNSPEDHKISPDFVGLRLSDFKFIYHEHLGVQDFNYHDKFISKLQKYRNNGITLGNNLILTFDDDQGSVNLALVEEVLRDAYFRH